MFRFIWDFFLWVDSVIFFSEEKQIERERKEVEALIEKVNKKIADSEAKINEDG
jgi:hypothetical protein